MSATPLRAQTPQAPSRTLTLAEYRAELVAAIALLEALPPTDADSDSETDTVTETVITELQDRFATMTTVELPSGAQVQVTSVLEGLDDVSSDVSGEDLLNNYTLQLSPQQLALARLQGALAQIEGAAQDNTAARLLVLDEILARPEFNMPVSLWDRIVQWFEDLLRSLIPQQWQGTGSSWLTLVARLLPWVITIVLLATILWLATYWLQRLLRSFVADAHVDTLGGDDDLPHSAAEARQQARVAAQSGLYRDAVRRLYLAALLQLSEVQLITYERTLTNREVLVRVPATSPIRPHLEPVIATFDQVWYGVREPDQAMFTAYEQEIDALAAVAKRTQADSAEPSNP